jgi:putative thioredoxin
VAPGTSERQEADRLAARVRVKDVSDGDVDELRKRVQADPDDLAGRFDLAHVLASLEQYEEALEQYLAIVSRDREFRDDAARKAMIDVFELLGSGDETAERYRSELAKVLFR